MASVDPIKQGNLRYSIREKSFHSTEITLIWQSVLDRIFPASILVTVKTIDPI